MVRLIGEVLEPFNGRVYPPACSMGGIFVQASKFIEVHRGPAHKAEIAIYGQEQTWRLAKMNLAIHGSDGDLAARWGDTFADDKRPALKADFVMADPPFNVKDWARDDNDARWQYGVPPRNSANFAWLQPAVSKLTDRGTAAVVLANRSLHSKPPAEAKIRQAIVDADLVACIMLFRTTQIPTCLWLLTKDKSSQGATGLTDPLARSFSSTRASLACRPTVPSVCRRMPTSRRSPMATTRGAVRHRRVTLAWPTKTNRASASRRTWRPFVSTDTR